jgi:ribonuclease P protein component
VSDALTGLARASAERSTGPAPGKAPSRSISVAPQRMSRQRGRPTGGGAWCSSPAPVAGWRGGLVGSTLVVARRRSPSTRVVAPGPHRPPGDSMSPGRRVRRGAELPGRPQVEAHIPAERPEAGEAPRVPPPHVDQGGPGHPVGAAAQGSPQPVGLIWAVRDRATFEALRRRGRRVRRGPLTVTWVAGDPAVPPRVAFAIGRKTGGAVARNLLRRRLRAIAREVVGDLRPGAYLFGATAATASLPYDDLRATVCSALGALHHPRQG